MLHCGMAMHPMNKVYLAKLTPWENADYDQTRAAVVIAPDVKTVKQMLNESHSYYPGHLNWLDNSEVKLIGESKLKTQIVLTEAHEG
jgi:hypothetical protein